MLRPDIIQSLIPLFADGCRPSGADFSTLITGLGYQTDRPHMVFSVDTASIPDAYILDAVWGGEEDGTDSGLALSVLSSYFHNGILADCVVTSTVSGAMSMYIPAYENPVGESVVIWVVQLNNSGFDLNGIKSEDCIRIYSIQYPLGGGSSIVTSTPRLLLLSSVVSELGGIISSQIDMTVTPVGTPIETTDGVTIVESQTPVSEALQAILTYAESLAAGIVEVKGDVYISATLQDSIVQLSLNVASLSKAQVADGSMITVDESGKFHISWGSF